MISSSDFRKILDKESQFSSNQFESAQWRRLELQAAGCRLLGYSGVQIMGVDTPANMEEQLPKPMSIRRSSKPSPAST